MQYLQCCTNGLVGQKKKKKTKKKKRLPLGLSPMLKSKVRMCRFIHFLLACRSTVFYLVIEFVSCVSAMEGKRISFSITGTGDRQVESKLLL